MRKGKENMPLQYKILRGEDKIGANLIEVSRGQTRILVEFGNELDNESGIRTNLEEDIISSNYTACVVSHYHGDHAQNVYALNCPVYMGEKCARVMATVAEYVKKPVAKNLVFYQHLQPFCIGNIKITPYLCDHSATDSYMLLFEGGGSLLYTGDFRASGRKNFNKLLATLPTRVDTLIIEGTNVGKQTEQMSEQELEQRAVEIMRESTKPVFVLQSSTNLDRLVSVYRATKRSGRRLVIDDFQAEVCNVVGGSIPRPDVFADVFAVAPRYLKGVRYQKFNHIQNKIKWQTLAGWNNYVMLVRTPTHINILKSLIKHGNLNGATLLYSMWNGYAQKQEFAVFLDMLKNAGVNIVQLHTSGHADEPTLSRLINHVAHSNCITIHTEGNSSKN